MFFGCDAEFVEECVMPDFFHVVPVCYDPVFDWVFERQDPAFRLGFVAAGGIVVRERVEGNVETLGGLTRRRNPSGPYRP